ncbi:MAG TPA: energy transducer TonB [Blastocatellia bacterium]|nr:energy transducer TonB [Blastocatellia bacterium]
MKISVIALCVWMGVAAQSDSLEKQAISIAQQIPVSSLDAQLPNRPFGDWFNEVVGRGAGVVWQLSECGGPAGGGEQDLLACAEASVLMPNGNRMILAISVGTFKKGITGQPAFYRAVIESDEQLYQVTRLRDLTSMLQSPRKMAPLLPDLQAGSKQVTPRPDTADLSSPPVVVDAPPATSKEDEKPPPPPVIASTPQKISQSVLEGLVIKKRQPAYPMMARTMGAMGKVEVRITIAEDGTVIEAEAISGHPALRSAAKDAALQWVYKPTTLNGIPTKVQTVLTFNFSPPQ